MKVKLTYYLEIERDDAEFVSDTEIIKDLIRNPPYLDKMGGPPYWFKVNETKVEKVTDND